MKNKAFKLVKYLFFFLTGVGILYYLFKGQYHPHFISDLKQARWGWVMAMGFAALISHVFRALRWQMMVGPLSIKKVGFFNTFNALMVGYLANLILPRAGEVARCVALGQKENISTTVLIGTVIAERIFDFLMLFLAMGVAFLFYAEVILSFLQKNLISSFISDKVLEIIGLLVLSLLAIGGFLFFHQKGAPLRAKIQSLYLKLKDGVFAFRKIKQPFIFVLYTVLIWVFYVLSSYLGFRIFSQTAHLGLDAALLMVVAGSFGMIAPIQGGIGAFHFMLTESLFLLGINKTTGLEFATLTHAVQTLIVIVFGLLGLSLGFKFKTFPK